MGRYTMRKCKWCESSNLSTEPKFFKDGSAHIALGCDDCGKHNQYINEAKENKIGNSRVKVADTRQRLIEEAGFETFEQYKESEKWSKIVQMTLERDNHKCKFCKARGCTIAYSIYTRGNIDGRNLDGIFSVCEYCNNRLTYTKDNHKRDVAKQMKFMVQCLKRGNV